LIRSIYSDSLICMITVISLLQRPKGFSVDPVILKDDLGGMILRKLTALITILLLFGVSLTCAQSISNLKKEVDFSHWLTERAEFIETEYAAGLDPMEIDLRARYDYELNLLGRNDTTSEEILKNLKFTEDIIVNKDLTAITGELASVIKYTVNLDPTLATRIWYMQMLETAQVIVEANFEHINGTVVPRDKKTNRLYITHNSTAHSDLIADPYPEGKIPCAL